MQELSEDWDSDEKKTKLNKLSPDLCATIAALYYMVPLSTAVGKDTSMAHFLQMKAFFSHKMVWKRLLNVWSTFDWDIAA